MFRPLHWEKGLDEGRPNSGEEPAFGAGLAQALDGERLLQSVPAKVVAVNLGTALANNAEPGVSATAIGLLENQLNPKLAVTGQVGLLKAYADCFGSFWTLISAASRRGLHHVDFANIPFLSQPGVRVVNKDVERIVLALVFVHELQRERTGWEFAATIARVLAVNRRKFALLQQQPAAKQDEFHGVEPVGVVGVVGSVGEVPESWQVVSGMSCGSVSATSNP